MKRKPAFEIVSIALLSGKDVVSASKKMIAEHLSELLDLQSKTGRSFLYESAACASIPVIRNLEEYYDNDLLHSIRAIVNGSTNYILTKIFDEQLDFQQALIQAQRLGFAESTQRLISGVTMRLTNGLSYSLMLTVSLKDPKILLFTGIQNIHADDALLAREKNYAIRLVAQAQKLGNGKVAAFVLPQFVKQDDPLALLKMNIMGW